MGMCKTAAVQGLGQTAVAADGAQVVFSWAWPHWPHQMQIKGSVPSGSAMALPSVISKST